MPTTPGRRRARRPAPSSTTVRTRARRVRPEQRRVHAARADMYRGLVIEAAERLFAERGVDDTRMEAIAAEAGLSLGTLYSVFTGKAEIVGAIHEVRLEEVLRRAVESAGDRDAPLAMLLAGVRTYVSFFLEHPSYLRMHLREGYSWAQGSGFAASGTQTEAWRKGVAMQAALFARGATEGVFYPGDPMVQTRMMIAMQQVQLASWVETGMTADRDALLDEIEQQVRRSFCPA